MNYIKILGASGSKSKHLNTTSFQIYKDIVVDAGNILNGLGNDARYINHIFLTHSHADHITDLPFVIETFFEIREIPLTIYALKETIEVIKKHSFNNAIWPDFTKIRLPKTNEYSLILKEIKIDEIVTIHDYKIKAFPAVHIKGACGFVISKKENAFIISGDTYKNPKIWEEINKNPNIKAILLECSFPDKMEELAKDSKHLTPKLIAEELKTLKRNDISIFLYHLKPIFLKELKRDIKKHGIIDSRGKILEENDVIHIDKGTIESELISDHKFEEIMKINQELSSEHNREKLLENILTLTKKLTSSEAGTLYIKSINEQNLEFKVVQNDELNIKSGVAKHNLDWPSLPIYLEDKSLNNSMVAVVSCNEKRIINISDVYKTNKYKFDGTKILIKEQDIVQNQCL